MDERAIALKEQVMDHGLILGDAILDLLEDASRDELKDVLRQICISRASFNVTARALALDAGFDDLAEDLARRL